MGNILPQETSPSSGKIFFVIYGLVVYMWVLDTYFGSTSLDRTIFHLYEWYDSRKNLKQGKFIWLMKNVILSFFFCSIEV